jgi:CHAD domain-containing protein
MSESPDLTFRTLAGRTVRRQAKHLAEQFDGIRTGEDIEFIHRARVASRRLRAALRIFRDCFESKQIKRWGKQIRRVTQGLGDARDTDVQIEFLCGVLGQVSEKACTPGIARLLAQLEHYRERLQAEVVEAVDRLEAGSALGEMLSVTKQMLADDKAEGQSRNTVARDRTRQSILRGLEEMLCHQESLRDPEDCLQHHAMRIAAKRLRYTLELAKPVYKGRLDESLEAVKHVQTLLGDMHDCDVWEEHLDAFAEEERARVLAHFGHVARYGRLEAGIEYLRRERREHRRQVFDELVQYWQKLNQQGLWDNLVRLSDPCGGQSVCTVVSDPPALEVPAKVALIDPPMAGPPGPKFPVEQHRADGPAALGPLEDEPPPALRLVHCRACPS